MGLPVVRLAGCFPLSALSEDALDFSTNAFVAHAHLLQPTPSDLRGAGSMSHRLLFANHVFFLLVDGGHFVAWRLLPQGSRSNDAAGGDRRRVNHDLASAQSAYKLGHFNLPGLLAAAPAIVFKREGDFVALVEGADPRPLKRARMDEHVLGAVLGSDETKTLGAIEELDCPGDSHEESLSRCA